MSPLRLATYITLGVWCFLIGVGFIVIYKINETLPSVSRLKEFSPPLATRVYSRDGKLLKEFYREKRMRVRLTDVPDYLKKATLLLEDDNFYKHSGVNLFSIIRAWIANLQKKRIVQGASTITQQLARNLFLTFEKTLLRKLKEALLAIKIERVFSKDEILEMYLTQIYYGNGVYGVEAAAQKYFGKSAKELTLPECALLAGLPKSPSYYDPFRHPERAIERRALVLEVLAQRGVISREEAEWAKNAPLNLAQEKKPPEFAGYFVEEVRKWLQNKFGEEFLYTSGAEVYTTLDPKFQIYAEEAVKNKLKQYSSWLKEDTTGPLQAALLAMNPHNGEILAMVGGRSFRESMFNRAVQARRQPGSAFKPFVWTVAVENGYTPATIVLDAPVVVKDRDTVYAPLNYDHKFLGRITLRDALAHSRNLVSVRLVMKFSPKKIVKLAKKLGVKSKLIPVVSIALGSNCVTLLDMVTAYSAFANGGERVIPHLVTKILDRDGNVIYEFKDKKERVLSPQVAYIVTSMMQSVVKYGTARSARWRGVWYPCAGKTGTTDEYTDAWFIGFTPDLVAGVWVGYDLPHTIIRGATGARYALPIWCDFMKQALRTMPVRTFRTPPGIVTRMICPQSGLLATSYCPSKRREVFIKGTEPKKYCDLHKPTGEKLFKRFYELDTEELKENP